MTKRLSYALAAAISFTVMSCSTTRLLPEGQERLTANRIRITNPANGMNVSEISPYLKQNATGWSPALCIYNWQNGKGKGWDKFTKKLGKPPVVFDSTMVAASIGNICDHLEYIGYYSSSVDARIDHRRNRKVRVDYNVTLGKRFPIKDISYELPMQREFIQEFYADTVHSTIKVGDYLSEDALEKESARSATALRNRGYYDFSKNFFFCEADTVSTPDSASLHIMVKEYTRNENKAVHRDFNKYTLGKISVSYPEQLRFRPEVLKQLNCLKSGDLYSERDINTTYSRFNSISLFNSVSMQLTARDDEPVVDCDISLQKGKIQGFKFGLEASINSNGIFGISPQLSYFNKNIFRGGEILNVSLSSNHQFKFRDKNVKSNEVAVAASLLLPRFIPFPTRLFNGPNLPQTKINVSYNFQKRPEFTRNRATAQFGYTGNYRRNLFYEFYPISWNLIRLPYIDAEFAESMKKNPFMYNSYQDHFDMGLNGLLYYSSVGNNANPKVTNWYGRLELDLAGNLLSAFKGAMRKNGLDQGLIIGIPFSQYVKVEASVGRTIVWGKKDGQALAMRLLIGAGHAYGNSMSLPFDKQFYGGGANSLRGWSARTVGPGLAPMNKEFVIPNQSGDMKMEANIEYRFLMFWKLSGALFIDAGNVWNLGKAPAGVSDESYLRWNTLASSIAADWGYGLRVDLNFIILRLDLGMRIHDPARTGSKWVAPKEWFKNNYAIHFGVGYPF
ncbi:MAG: BamA/TamA family outer membrane protein [Bacteroidales bacterium]|nr:BamA/TamA family outer membrane protein [Bacteroidales bacterium]